MCQIVSDGVKLCMKGMWSVGLLSDWLLVGTLLGFVGSYVGMGILWCEMLVGCGSVCWYVVVLVGLGVGHMGSCVCGYVLCGSVWTVLGSVRCVVVWLCYDVLLVGVWMVLSGMSVDSTLGVSGLGIGLLLSDGVSVGSVLGAHGVGIGVLDVVSGMVLVYGLLLECGRVPVDLGECESELVMGY